MWSILGRKTKDGIKLRKNSARINLVEADLRNLELDGIDFTEADLRGANFDGSSLKRAKLDRANLTSASLYRTDLYQCSAIETIFDLSGLTLANFTGAKLFGAKFGEAHLTYTNFTGARGDFLYISGRGHPIIALDENDIVIGCLRYPLRWWIENCERVGISMSYSREVIEEYRCHLLYLQEWYEKGYWKRRRQ